MRAKLSLVRKIRCSRTFAFENLWKCFKICLIFVRFQHFPSFFSFKKCVFKSYYPVKRANTLRDIESNVTWWAMKFVNFTIFS